ncbi:hypothetical protein WME94_09335 [Sorangium sp. So ce429]
MVRSASAGCDAGAQRSPGAHALLGCLLLLICLLIPARARAEGEGVRRLSVSFEVEVDRSPAYLCIITPSTAVEPNLAKTDGLISLSTFKDLTRLCEKGQFQEDRCLFAADPRTMIQSVPARTTARGPLLDAIEQMKKSDRPGQAAPCTAELEAKVVQNDRLFCVPNTQPRSTPAPQDIDRVAVLQLSAVDLSKPVLDRVELVGSTALLLLKYAGDAQQTKAVSLRTAGGHYLPNVSRATAGGPVSLPLVPRCGKHVVRLPPYRLEGAKSPAVQFIEDGQPSKPSPVEVKGDQEIHVWIPYALGTGSRALSVTFEPDPAALTGDPAAAGRQVVFEAQWSDAIPPRVLSANVRELSVSWKPHCVYSASVCPALSLPQSGLVCAPEVAALATGSRADCSYQCTVARGRPPFSLPARVVMRAREDGHEETWEDEIRYANERLDGYTPSAERHLYVDFSEWSMGARPRSGDNLKQEQLIEAVTRRPGQTIDYVEVRAPGGGVYRLKPKAPRVRLHMPGLGCNDFVSYNVVGDLDYRETTERVQNGRLTIKQQHRLLKAWFGLGLTAGVGVQFAPTDFHNDTAARPYAVAEGVLVLRPFTYILQHWRPNLEVRAGAILTEQWYQTLIPRKGIDSGQTSEGAVDSIWFVRVPLTVNAVWNFFDAYAGAGLGFAFGFPLFRDDNDRGLVQISPELIVPVGLRLTKRVTSEVTFRWIPNESLYRYTFDYRGGPRGATQPAHYFLLEGKLRLDD